MFPGQHNAFHRPQGPYLENKMLRPPGTFDTDFLDGSSRKRKATPMDRPGPRIASAYGYSFPLGSNLQKGTSFGAQVEDKTCGFYSNQIKTTESANFKHQYDKYQFQYQNSYPGSLGVSTGNSLRNEAQNLCTVVLPSLDSPNMHAADSVVGSILQSQTYNVSGPRQCNRPLDSGVVYGGANHKYDYLQNKVQFDGSVPFGVPCGEQGNGDTSGRTTEKTEVLDIKNSNHPSPGVSPKSYSPLKAIENCPKNDLVRASISLEEKDKTDDGKAVPVVAEKLWEGSLQLSSSVTVSLVASFKSGEKLHNSNWYEFVEVKGKVKLEAFEKYIQDLPRSRNKGLMVISLCWKEGSSEIGLKGMKEVARGYRKAKRVGFAHLSPEIHLYICPQSEAIITILAKYGFFKGMAAIEDKQDAMVGCVVWRKRTPSDSIARKTENKSMGLPPKSANEESDSEDSPLTQLVQEIIAPLSTTITSTTDGDGENGDKEIKNGPPIETQIDATNSWPSAQLPQGDLTIVNKEPTKWLELEQCKEKNFQNLTIPSPCEIAKDTRPGDDDDLPEYDFTAACAPSLPSLSKPLEGENSGKRLSPKVTHNLDMPMQRGVPHEQAKPLPLPISSHFGKKEDVQNQLITSSVSNVVFASRKNLFDDDDMPEWCPPPQFNFPSNIQNSPQGPLFSSQGLPPVCHLHTLPPRPLQRSSSSEIGSNSNLIWGPPPGFHADSQLCQADKQGHRPR